MNDGDQVLVKSTTGAGDLEGTVTRVWNDAFVRVLVVRPSVVDDVLHHDHVDMPVGGPVGGYDSYAVLVSSAQPSEEPPPQEPPPQPEGGE